jgi:hypothetical protein
MTAPNEGTARKQPQDEPGDTIRVRVRWSEIVTREASRELDATRMRRLGYDPQDPHSIASSNGDCSGAWPAGPNTAAHAADRLTCRIRSS